MICILLIWHTFLSVTIIRFYFGKRFSSTPPLQPKMNALHLIIRAARRPPHSHHWQGPLAANKPLQTNRHSKSSTNSSQFHQPTSMQIHSTINKSKESQKCSENDIKSKQIIIKWLSFLLTQTPPLLLLVVASGWHEALHDSLPPLPIKSASRTTHSVEMKNQ